MSENTNSTENSGCSGSCSSCASAGSCGQESLIEELNFLSSIKKVIGIVSGKGGVGKSFVTASMAVELANKGYKVGILDADITGPSIPKMFGIKSKAEGCDDGIFPASTKLGIKVMSVNLLLPNEDDPVIWRGPVIAGVVKQFWTDVIWGDLDYLLVDLPPGTGDVPLTVFQSIPVDGIVIVTSPQDLVQLIVKKAYNMAEKMNIPVIGIVENYSYLECPDCGKKINIFGTSKIDDAAKDLGIKVLGKMPVMPEMAELADAGLFDKITNEHLADAINAVI
ncbi:MAG: P-loop NTPase [Eubacterium sp.]